MKRFGLDGAFLQLQVITSARINLMTSNQKVGPRTTAVLATERESAPEMTPGETPWYTPILKRSENAFQAMN